MTVAPQNTIDNAELHFKLSSLPLHMGNGDAFVSWAKTNVLKAIDHHAEDLTATDAMVQIPTLELDIVIDQESDFFSDPSNIQAIVWDKVYNGLKKAIRQSDTTETAVSEYQATIVLDFIRTGQLSTYYTDEHWNNLVNVLYDTIPENKRLREQLFKTVRNEGAFNRLSNLRSLRGLGILLDRILGKAASNKLKIALRFIQDHPDYFKPIHLEEFYYRVFLTLGTNGNNLQPLLFRLLRGLQVSKGLTRKKLRFPSEVEQEMKVAFYESVTELKKTKAPVREKGFGEEPSPLIEKGAHVGQAGLVLLAPFLPKFLRNLGHIGTNGQLRRRSSIPMLLHYLATGETSALEWKLTLPKVLAGMAPGTHCATNIRPSKKRDAQINELLKSVIGHWEALKNTSPAGLQATFLMRQGTLKTKNGFDYLYITERTEDILLNYIPWNYTTIKYDWMPNILFVEWNKS
ncbi:hypothetical protein FK220_001685 [Flavobacteriaceae bacterium TP-CH-4]|uniref:Uncharacterized protein n=1 Tax=Pelagihabitans pacificus TaxID=2696054 RepID=A0A967ASB8_9FLAO|nr:contractile injection system tape measure protein [Pelagihabitans pacificus]NHF58033.1 hypothetical protein [Pelagihabitans pacificus]